jgi:hypothetical protein
LSWRGRLGPLIPTASLRPRENPAQEGAVDALRAHRHFLKQEDICSKQDQETARQKRMTIRGEGLLLDLAFLGSSLCGEKNREQVELMQLNRGETGWRSIWWSCRPGRCWRPICTRPYGWRKGRWKGSQKTEVDAWPGVLACYRRFFVLPGAACSRL